MELTPRPYVRADTAILDNANITFKGKHRGCSVSKAVRCYMHSLPFPLGTHEVTLDQTQVLGWEKQDKAERKKEQGGKPFLDQH